MIRCEIAVLTARKYQDMHDRLDILYDRISELEEMIADIEAKISGAYGEKITADQLYRVLLNFDKMYYKMADLEKKRFMRDFIKEIELYPEKQDDGRILRKPDTYVKLSLKIEDYYRIMDQEK